MLIYEICVRLVDGENSYPFHKRGDIVAIKPADMIWSWDLMELESSEHIILKVPLVEDHVLALSNPFAWSLLIDSLHEDIISQINGHDYSEYPPVPIDVDTESIVTSIRRKQIK